MPFKFSKLIKWNHSTKTSKTRLISNIKKISNLQKEKNNEIIILIIMYDIKWGNIIRNWRYLKDRPGDYNQFNFKNWFYYIIILSRFLYVFFLVPFKQSQPSNKKSRN